MNNRFLLLLTALCFVVQLHGQMGFHRTYELVPGDTLIHFDATLSGGGAYYNVAGLQDSSEIKALVLTGYSTKGNVNWSRTIYSVDSIPFIGQASLTYGDNNTLYVSACVNNVEDNKVLYLFSNQGQLIDTKYISRNEGDDSPAQSFIAKSLRTDLWHATAGGDLTLPYASLNKMDAGGTILANYTFANQNETTGVDVPTDIQGVKFLEDTTLLVYGQTLANINDVSSFIRRMDTLGQEIWSGEYRYNTTNNYQLTFNDVVMDTDSTVVAVGTIFENDSNFPILAGVITYLDSVGDELWSRQLDFGTFTFSNIYDVQVSNTGDIHVYAEIVDLFINVTASLLITFDKEGNQINEFPLYDGALPAFSADATLLDSEDNGYAIFTTAIVPGGLTNNFIKVDANLETPCSDTIDQQISRAIELRVGSIDFNEETDQYVAVDSIVTVRAYNGYNVPVLILEDTTYCPNEPIFKMFDATPSRDSATAYAWSTGEETAKITVTEEGMYMVTVTMGENVCYTLCDTVMIDRYQLPQAAITASEARYCADRELDLFLNYQPGHPTIASIEWSTGEDTRDIAISELGQYSVTVTDECGEEAEAMFTLTEFPDISSQIEVLVNNTSYCTEGIGLNAVLVSGQEIASYEWENGALENQIFVDNPGNYVVTATNICDETVTFTANAMLPDTMGTVIIEENIIEDTITGCQVAELTAIYTGIQPDLVEEGDYVWSNGETGSQITVDLADVYTVSVTNACGFVNAVEFEVVFAPITWPKVFFPRGQEDDNKTFGPVISCPDLLDNYEFRIYNRWGNEVFSTTDPAQKWNGQYEGEPAPVEVYVYWAKYTFNGQARLDKGDVMLLK